MTKRYDVPLRGGSGTTGGALVFPIGFHDDDKCIVWLGLGTLIGFNLYRQQGGDLEMKCYSNAVILNPSFSLALSRFLLTITMP